MQEPKCPPILQRATRPEASAALRSESGALFVALLRGFASFSAEQYAIVPSRLRYPTLAKDVMNLRIVSIRDLPIALRPRPNRLALFDPTSSGHDKDGRFCGYNAASAANWDVTRQLLEATCEQLERDIVLPRLPRRLLHFGSDLRPAPATTQAPPPKPFYTKPRLGDQRLAIRAPSPPPTTTAGPS